MAVAHLESLQSRLGSKSTILTSAIGFVPFRLLKAGFRLYHELASYRRLVAPTFSGLAGILTGNNISAMRFPAATSSSGMLQKYFPPSAITSSTFGRGKEPPRTVMVPCPLITVVTPSSS